MSAPEYIDVPEGLLTDSFGEWWKTASVEHRGELLKTAGSFEGDDLLAAFYFVKTGKHYTPENEDDDASVDDDFLEDDDDDADIDYATTHEGDADEYEEDYA